MIDLRKLADILQPPDHDAVRRGRSPIEDLERQSVVPIMPPTLTGGANDISFHPSRDTAVGMPLPMPGGADGVPVLQQPFATSDAPAIPVRTPFANPPEQSGLIAPPEPEPTPPRFALSPSMRTRAEIDRIEQKDYSKRPNPNYDPTKPATTRNSPGGDTNNKYVYGDDYDRSRGFKDFLRSAGLGALGGFIRGGVGGAIGGAAAGGVRGAIDPNTDNRMIDAMKLEGLYPQYQRQFETETARRKAEQEAAKRGAEIQGEQAETAKKVLQAVQQRNPVLWEAIKHKGFIDANDQAAIQQAGYGYVPQGSWFQTETIYDKDGNLLWTPKIGTPNYQSTGIQDPKQGTSIYKGRPMKPSEAGRLETDEQQFNVRETNDVAAKNAQMQTDVARRNIDRDVDYNNRTLGVLQKIAESNAAVLAANPQMQSYARSMQVASDNMKAAAQAGDQETFAAAQAKFDAANDNFGKALANIQGNQTLAAEYRKTIGKRPPKEVFKPITAQTTNTKVAQSADVDAFAKSKGWSRKQAENYLKGQGYTIQ